MSVREESIRLSDWLASRSPLPPLELSERLSKIVGDSSSATDDLSAALLKLGLGVLANVGDDRAAAPDLLAADALITYAMEAAAESDAIESAATDAMREIASEAKR